MPAWRFSFCFILQHLCLQWNYILVVFFEVFFSVLAIMATKVTGKDQISRASKTFSGNTRRKMGKILFWETGDFFVYPNLREYLTRGTSLEISQTFYLCLGSFFSEVCAIVPLFLPPDNLIWNHRILFFFQFLCFIKSLFRSLAPGFLSDNMSPSNP